MLRNTASGPEASGRPPAAPGSNSKITGIGRPRARSDPQSDERGTRLACALGGLARPFARPPDRPETCENHRKSTKIIGKRSTNYQNLPKP